MGFLPKGNYVDLAKRYRPYAIDSGLFVSLKDKIAQRPIVASLIGTPFAGLSVLRNKKPASVNYYAKNPESNRRLHPRPEYRSPARLQIARLRPPEHQRLRLAQSGIRSPDSRASSASRSRRLARHEGSV
jgi:hypothetical protein